MQGLPSTEFFTICPSLPAGDSDYPQMQVCFYSTFYKTWDFIWSQDTEHLSPLLKTMTIRYPGQGVLQGSSSTVPIYNFNLDVSLVTYKKLATGATFTHPISGEAITDLATQYVDDKTEMINENGLQQFHQNQTTNRKWS